MASWAVFGANAHQDECELERLKISCCDGNVSIPVAAVPTRRRESVGQTRRSAPLTRVRGDSHFFVPSSESGGHNLGDSLENLVSNFVCKVDPPYPPLDVQIRR